MPARDPEFVGARIKEARLERGLRQAAFVGPLVSPGYVSLIEQGKRMPSRKALNHILSILEMSEHELFKQRDVDFSPKARATVARADLLITQGNLDGAAGLLKSLPQYAFNLPEVQLVNVEILLATEPAKALYVLDQQIDAFISHNQWTHVLRNISISMRALAEVEQSIEAIVYLSRVHRLLLDKSDADSVVVTVVVSELAKRLVFMGDVDGARTVIEDSSAFYFDALNLQKRAEFLLKQAEAAYESGAYEVSIDLSRVAQRLLRGESHLQVDSARDHALAVIGTIVAQIFPADQELNAKLQAVIQQQLEFSEEDRKRRALASVAMASLHLATKNESSAGQYLEYIPADAKFESDIEFERQLASAQVAIAKDNLAAARVHLGHCVTLIEAGSVGAKANYQASRLAVVYESIGDADLAYAVLRGAQKRIPNESANAELETSTFDQK